MNNISNEPEILVPPDMEKLEVEESNGEIEFPILKLLYVIVSSLAIIIFVCIGLLVYVNTQSLEIAWPFWAVALLILPFAMYFYYSLVSFFASYEEHKRLEDDQ